MRHVLALLVGLGFAAPATAQLTSTAIFKTGDAAPGTEAGVTFSGFAWPQANSSGQVMFYGILQGTGVNSTNNVGLWVAGPGGGLAARTGMQAPGCASGEMFESVHLHQQFTESGLVAFDGHLNTTFPNNLGYWAGGPGSLELVGRTGKPVPGQPGMTFGQTLQGPLINASGTVAFAANVVGQPSALFIGTGAGLTPYLRPGTTAAPGMPAGATFDFYQLDNFNAAGHLAFYGRAAGGGLTSTNDEGIWAGPPNNLTLVAREGSPMPNGPAGGNLFSFSPPQLNDQGQLLFRGSMSGVPAATNNAVWFGTPSNMNIIAQRGTQAPGMPAGATYLDLMASPSTNIMLGNGGTVALRALVTGGGVTTTNDQGFWVGTGGNLSLAIREGDAVPGASGLNFGEVTTDTPAVSSLGLAAVKVKLTGGGVTTSNDEAIWVVGSGTRMQVARKGDLIDLDPGAGTDLRTISSLDFIYEGFKGSYLAWHAEFTDNTEAVFLTPVPEPTGVLLTAGVGLVGVILRRRRRAS